jgi:hypothetical protein
LLPPPVGGLPVGGFAAPLPLLVVGGRVFEGGGVRCGVTGLVGAPIDDLGIADALVGTRDIVF